MQLTEKEKRLIFIVSIFLVACVGGPWAAEEYSFDYESEKTRSVVQLREEIGKYEQDIAGIDEQRELLRANRQDYLKWVKEGVVGEQNPIKWIELMQEIQKSRGLFETGMSWAGGDTVVESSASPLTSDSSVNIVFTDLMIEMPMLHDLDVLMFLSDMKRQSTSFFIPVECSFDRLENRFELVKRKNMMANCTINWVSVNDPESVVGKDEA